MKVKDVKMLDVNRVMRDAITIQKKNTEDEIQDLDSYTDFIKVQSEVNHRKSRIINQASAENTRKYIIFRIRYRNDLDETMRIIYKNEPYQIESIIPLSNENLYLEITTYQFKNDMFGV